MTDYQQIILDHIQSEYLADDTNEPLALDTSLVDQGIIDSMGIFRLIAFLQETFEISIEPSDVLLRHFKNVETIAALVSQKMNA